ncbi:MAG: lipoyl(octanoyl) transferase LipB [Candidatus Omnitrophica bacterium]|nr:lipoyl(octanoyl) transferase LipB [Candidatus Omnitrophota bacterium]
MELKIFDLRLIEFEKAWKFQKEIFQQVQSGSLDFALILCQHYPVITLGRNAKNENLLVSLEELKNKGIERFEIERGGDITYHGPGQLTIYPIFNLANLKKDIHWFLRELEQVVIEFLADFGLSSQRKPGFTGVWIGERKIASIGVAIRHWITFHGVSINIKTADLENFKLIRPCGMDIEMVALEQLIGREIEIEKIKNNLVHKFAFLCKEVCHGQSSLAGIR